MPLDCQGLGGAYSGASGETDANGYYEIAVPWGAAHFYAAGYTIDYGDGRAALGLHPADGRTGSFASPNGEVENFVLLPYGIADRDATSESPQHANNYYGGSIYIGYWLCQPCDTLAPKSNIPADSEIEITLTAEGSMADGGAGASFVIRKVASDSGFSINNIPVGRYRISAKFTDSKPLKMRQNSPVGGSPFGMQPTETNERASILLYPDSAKANLTIPSRGNWKKVEVYVERP